MNNNKITFLLPTNWKLNFVKLNPLIVKQISRKNSVFTHYKVDEVVRHFSLGIFSIKVSLAYDKAFHLAAWSCLNWFAFHQRRKLTWFLVNNSTILEEESFFCKWLFCESSSFFYCLSLRQWSNFYHFRPLEDKIKQC